MGTTSSHEEPLIGQIIGGRYEVVRLIGKGGMGSIYEVRNTRLGRAFAMKTLTSEAAADPRLLERFRREADVIARIHHPNIVDIVDWESLDDGSPAIVMEYLRGEDLSQRLERGALAWPLLARVADEMLAALSIAHANGVLHRDLKPQNVFLAVDDAGDERVKLLDFGVSKVRDSRGLVTSEDRLVGTPAYMSPEQADGRANDVGTHSDVWAIGVILHEMATGELAFSAPSVPSILYRICHGSPASLLERRPDAPPAFVELVAATLAPDIDRRIADATVLRTRLREALRDVAGVHFADPLPSASTVPTGPRAEVVAADTGSITGATPSSLKRRSLAWVALAIAGLAATFVVIAIVVATRSKPARAVGSSSAVAKPGTDATATGTAAIERVAPVDAAVATTADSPHEPAAITAPAQPIQRTRVTKLPTTDAPPRVPATVDPPKVYPGGQAEPGHLHPGPPRVDAKKKRCAKDDVECLYGDGT